MKNQNIEVLGVREVPEVVDVFEAARRAFFSGSSGNAASSTRQTFTQVKSYDAPVAAKAVAPKTISISLDNPELVAAR